MKYLLITEINAEDVEAFFKKNDERVIDSEKNPDRYPKRVGAAYFVLAELPKLSPDSIKGFEIVEADSEEQMENYNVYWWSARVAGIAPSLRKYFVPIAQANKVGDKMRT